jgi:glycosyltransferase involved in cell wall biosynthesis
LLIQWVPHGYGYRSLNLPFCLWLWGRAACRRDRVELMVHEPYLAFRRGNWRQSAAALVHRLMTAVLLQAARRVWVAIPAWEVCWRPYALGRRIPFTWLPVPSTVPVVEDAAGVAAIRLRYGPAGGFLVGHLGTYGPPTAELLAVVLPLILRCRKKSAVLLLGRGGERVRDELLGRHADLAGRLHATGLLPAADLSRHLSACDLMLQPFPDGVSSRRTSVMAALAHGLPVATTTGPLTEPLWAESGAVSLTPSGDIPALAKAAERLLADEAERQRLSAAARVLYQGRFEVSHTIRALRAAPAAEVATVAE